MVDMTMRGSPAKERRTKIGPGEKIPSLTLTTMTGEEVPIPDSCSLVHLQFRRFAGCPVCDLHMSHLKRRHEEIDRFGIKEVVVFHSTTEELRKYAGDLPFALIPDPEKRLYRQFGVRSSARSLLDPRAWPYVLAGIGRSVLGMITAGTAAPPMAPEGGSLGLPADFLIGSGGVVLARKYGEHAYDQWSVDELIELAQRQVGSGEPSSAAAATAARPMN